MFTHPKPAVAGATGQDSLAPSLKEVGPECGVTGGFSFANILRATIMGMSSLSQASVPRPAATRVADGDFIFSDRLTGGLNFWTSPGGRRRVEQPSLTTSPEFCLGIFTAGCEPVQQCVSASFQDVISRRVEDVVSERCRRQKLDNPKEKSISKLSVIFKSSESEC
jgi:hypothetical protein